MEREINNTSKLQCLYHRYKDVIFFNKNIILAGLASLIVGSIVTQVYALHYGYTNNFTNSVLSLATEYSVFFPFFAILYYRDNKFRYLDPVTGKRNVDRIKSDREEISSNFFGIGIDLLIFKGLDRVSDASNGIVGSVPSRLWLAR